MAWEISTVLGGLGLFLHYLPSTLCSLKFLSTASDSWNLKLSISQRRLVSTRALLSNPFSFPPRPRYHVLLTPFSPTPRYLALIYSSVLPIGFCAPRLIVRLAITLAVVSWDAGRGRCGKSGSSRHTENVSPKVSITGATQCSLPATYLFMPWQL